MHLTHWSRSSLTDGTGRTRGSGRHIRPGPCASTRFGPRWVGSTAPMGIGIWSVAALPSKRMGLYKAEKAERTLGVVEWFLWVDETPRPGWANMAIDEALLDRAEQVGESWLRLYTWKPHCLSFGRHEPAARRYDVDRVTALGIDTVRRPTGGRAVWHSRELTYAVVSPCCYFGSLAQAYLEIHETLAQALTELGVDASLAPQSRAAGLHEGACFERA